LKPDNVLVTDLLRAKIADFGASRAMSLAGAMAATIVGTPLFAAPEIMRGEAYGAPCDVYSFGMLLLDLASADGLLPLLLRRWRASQPGSGSSASSGRSRRATLPKADVDERDSMAMIRDVWTGVFRPVSVGGPPVPNAPPAVSTLAARCLLHDPAARPTFADALATLAGACALEAETGKYARGAGSAVDGGGSAATTHAGAAATAATAAAAAAAAALASGDWERAGKASTHGAGADPEKALERHSSSAQQSNLLQRSQVYRASLNPLTAGAGAQGSGRHGSRPEYV
jgi:hypothetical protein